MKEEKKKIIVQIIGFLVSMFLIISGYVFASAKIEVKNQKDAVIESKIVRDYNILADFSISNKEDKSLTLSGWALKLDAKQAEMKVVIQATDDSKAYVIDAQRKKSLEVNEFFSLTREEELVGFEATIANKYLSKDTCYKVLLTISYLELENQSGVAEWVLKDKKIDTGKYLYNGELYTYDPLTFEEPKIQDSELLSVLEEGVLRGYSAEKCIWIYQQGDFLYYIYDPGKVSEKKAYIQILPSTYRTDLLPEDRQEAGNTYWIERFDDVEYEREGISPYQVCKVSLVTGYPITYVDTGLYDLETKESIEYFRFMLTDRLLTFEE